MAIIQDPGSSEAAKVTEKRLHTDSKQGKRIFYESRDSGRAFVWTSVFNTSGTNVEIMMVQNTSTDRKLFLDSAHYSSAAACIFTVQKHTGTATGTTITGEVLNFKSVNPTAEATALGDGAVTAGTIGNKLASALSVAANADGHRDWNAEIILGEGDAVIITASANTTIQFDLTGFFEA